MVVEPSSHGWRVVALSFLFAFRLGVLVDSDVVGNRDAFELLRIATFLSAVLFDIKDVTNEAELLLDLVVCYTVSAVLEAKVGIDLRRDLDVGDGQSPESFVVDHGCKRHS